MREFMFFRGSYNSNTTDFVISLFVPVHVINKACPHLLVIKSDDDLEVPSIVFLKPLDKKLAPS